jgi:hypothetical protein
MLDVVLTWQNIVAELAERSQSIVPVYKRTEIVESPFTISALCGYKNGDVSIELNQKKKRVFITFMFLVHRQRRRKTCSVKQ